MNKKKNIKLLLSILFILYIWILNSFLNVFAWYSSLEAANKLALLWVIEDNTQNPDNYRIDENITRAEMAKTTINLSIKSRFSSELIKDKCEEKFTDLSSWNWACKYVESWLEKGYFSLNKEFRPNDDITKIEALKMIMKARWFDKTNNSDWRVGYVENALKLWIIEKIFTDYDNKATRWWIFKTSVDWVEVL